MKSHLELVTEHTRNLTENFRSEKFIFGCKRRQMAEDVN